MNIILFDEKERSDLLPLTFTRPTAELRVGILTFTERWKKILSPNSISFLTEEYLSKKYKLHTEKENLFINPLFFPDQDLILTIKNLKPGEALYSDDDIIAARSSIDDFYSKNFSKKINAELTINNFHIKYPWDLFTYNSRAISYDFDLITSGRKSMSIPESVNVIGDKNKIFIEKGASLEYVTLNTREGVIYIGENSEIMEGSMIRGALALCLGSKINMGAKIYGGTTIGPYCKVGGEVNNIIMTGYSNKGHEGFLGNSVIGEWCNLGADTNASNLKNNYAEVKCWNYPKSAFINTGLQFAGLIMGDHSKTAINTQFNTGTVVGVFANIFTTGFPPNIIKSFAWGGNSECQKFKLAKAFEIAKIVMNRRNISLSDEDKKILKHVFDHEM